jgi:hypothetical protein
MDSEDTTQQAEGNRAIRLLVEYDASGFKVRDRWQIETLAPPSHPLQVPRATGGFWVELRDAKNNVVYRRVMPNPVQTEVEVFDPELGPHRQPTDATNGSFTVLVPDIPEAEQLAFVSSSSDPARRQNAARLVTAVPLREAKGRRR